MPLMTCYLTDATDPEDVARSYEGGVFAAVKLYPANATTNSASGITDYDDEVDACSGALEMLNPPMQSWAAYELARREAEAILAGQQRKPQPAPPDPARGSMEWQARQNSRDQSS